jgi:hypothetical protein
MSWLSDKVQGIKEWFSPVTETASNTWWAISSAWNMNYDPVDVDVSARREHEDFLVDKWISFGWILWDISDFAKSLPVIGAVTQSPMEKVETYAQKFSPTYQSFRDNVDTIQAMVNAWQLDYSLWIKTIQWELDKLQNNSKKLSDELKLTNKELKINDIEELLDIWLKTKEKKNQVLLEANEDFTKKISSIFGTDLEKQERTKNNFKSDFTDSINENVQNAMKEISEWKRKYNWDILEWDYFLWQNIPKLIDYAAEKYNNLQILEDRAQEVIDEAKKSWKDVSGAEDKKTAITKIKDDYKNKIVNFSKYYIDNIWREWSEDFRWFIDAYKETTGTDMDELLGMKSRTLSIDHESNAQALADQIDMLYRPMNDKGIFDKWWLFQKVDVTIATAASWLNKWLFEAWAEKIWEATNALLWWQYVSDPFTKTDNTYMKNFLFSFNENMEPKYLEKVGNTIIQIWPEIAWFLLEAWALRKVTKWTTIKWLELLQKWLKWLWFFDEVEELRRYWQWLSNVASKLSWIWNMSLNTRRIAVSDAIRNMPRIKSNVVKDIIAWTVSTFVNWPVLSWLFDAYNPQWYQKWDAALDFMFMWLDALVDTWRLTQKYSKTKLFQNVLNEPWFYDQYYKRLFGVSDDKYKEYTPAEVDFARLYSADYLNRSLTQAKKIENIKPWTMDKVLQVVRWIYAAKWWKSAPTVLREASTKIVDQIYNAWEKSFIKTDKEIVKTRSNLMPSPVKEAIEEWEALWKLWFVYDKNLNKIRKIHINSMTPVFKNDLYTDQLIYRYFHTQNYKQYLNKTYWSDTILWLESAWKKIKWDAKKQLDSDMKKAKYYLDKEDETIRLLEKADIDYKKIWYDVYTKDEIDSAMKNMDKSIIDLFWINPEFQYLKISWDATKDIYANIYMNTFDWIVRLGIDPKDTDFAKYLAVIDLVDKSMFPWFIDRKKMLEELFRLKDAWHYKQWTKPQIESLMNRMSTLRVLFEWYIWMISLWKAARFLIQNSTDHIIWKFIFNILDSDKKDLYDLVTWDLSDENIHKEIFYNMIKWDAWLLKATFWDDIKLLSLWDLQQLVWSKLLTIKQIINIRDNMVRSKLGLLPITPTIYDGITSAEEILHKALYIKLINTFDNPTEAIQREINRIIDLYFKSKSLPDFYKKIDIDKKISDLVKKTVIKRDTAAQKAVTKKTKPPKVKMMWLDRLGKSLGVDIIYNKTSFDDVLSKIPEANQFKKTWGIVYWFVKDGKIYLNPLEATDATLFHEWSHIWYRMANKVNPELFQKVNDLVRKTRYYQDVVDTLDYLKTEQQRLDEAFARGIEDWFNNSWLTQSWIAIIKKWLKDFYTTIIKALWIENSLLMKDPTQIANLTFSDLQRMVLWDLASWKQISSYELSLWSTPSFSRSLNIPWIWFHRSNYTDDILREWFKLWKDIKKWEWRWYVYMSPTKQSWYSSSRNWFIAVDLSNWKFETIDVKDLPRPTKKQLDKWIINWIDAYWVKKWYNWTVITNNWEIQEILTTKQYANNNIIRNWEVTLVPKNPVVDDMAELWVAFSVAPVTSKFIEDIDKATKKNMIPKSFIQWWINRQWVYKQPDLQYAIDTLDEFVWDVIPKDEYVNSFKMRLMPLNQKETSRWAHYNYLRDDIWYPVDEYYSLIFESPFTTKVWNNHFWSETDNYFSHWRIEWIWETNRVIEIQSDLFQRQRYLDEIEDIDKYLKEAQDEYDRILKKIDILNDAKKIWLEGGNESDIAEYIYANKYSLWYYERATNVSDIDKAIKRLQNSELLETKDMLDTYKEMKKKNIDISLKSNMWNILYEKRERRRTEALLENFKKVKEDQAVKSWMTVSSYDDAKQLTQNYWVGEYYDFELSSLSNAKYDPNRTIEDITNEKIEHFTNQLKKIDENIQARWDYINNRKWVRVEEKNRHLKNYANIRYEREIRELFSRSAMQWKKYVEFPDPYTIAYIEWYLNSSWWAWIVTRNLGIGDTYIAPNGEMMIIDINGVDEAKVINTNNIKKTFTYDEAYDDALNYYYDSLQRDSYELWTMIDDMLESEFKEYKNYAIKLQEDWILPKDIEITDHDLKDAEFVIEQPELRDYVRDMKEWEYVSSMIDNDFHDAESYVNYYNGDMWRDGNLFYNPKDDLIYMFDRPIDNLIDIAPVRDSDIPTLKDNEWYEYLGEDQKAVVDFYKNKVLPYVEKYKKWLTEYVEVDWWRWLRAPVTANDSLPVVAFKVEKPKTKQEINKEIKKLRQPEKINAPLVLTKKFDWDSILTVPLESIADLSDDVIRAQASREWTLLDYLLNNEKINVDEYRTLVKSTYLTFWWEDNTFKKIEYMLMWKWYDGIMYNGEKVLLNEPVKIAAKEESKNVLERQLDNYDTQIQQYHDTKNAMDQNAKSEYIIKDWSLQIVWDILPDAIKNAQQVINTIQSKYRIGEKTLYDSLNDIIDDEFQLNQLASDISEGNMTWTYNNELAKNLAWFFTELSERTWTLWEVFSRRKFDLNPEFIVKFTKALKYRIDILRLIKMSDEEFYKWFRDSPARFEELFWQTAENFEKVRFAMQLAAWDDYMGRWLMYFNKWLWLAYKLPATYFWWLTMVCMNAIQNTIEIIFKDMKWTFTGESMATLRKKYGIMVDESLIDSIWWWWQWSINAMLSKTKREYLFNDLFNNGAYNFVENIASWMFINKSVAQAMQEKWFQNVDEFEKFMSVSSEASGNNMILYINRRAMEIFELRTGSSFNREWWKFVFGKLQTKVWEEWLPSVFWRSWNALMNTYMFMGTWWTRHIINSFRLISTPWASRKLYFQIMEEKWLAEANKLIKQYYERNFDTQLLVNKIFTSLWAWGRLDRIIDNEIEDEPVFDISDMYELWQLFYAPLQSILSSPFWRAMYRFINWVFMDKNHQDIDINNINAWVLMLFKQIMNDLWRKFALPRAMLWAMNPAAEENFFVWTVNNLMDSTKWLMNMLSDEIISKWFDFDVPRSNSSFLNWIIPGLDKRKQKYFDESTLMKLKMIEEWDQYSFKNWFIYSIPFLKDYKTWAFADYKYQELVSKLWNDPVYVNAIMEWKLPIDWDLWYIENIFSIMTQRNLSQSNTLLEWWKNFEQRFLWGASFLNSKEKAVTEMLLDYLEKWEVDAFIKAFNETDSSKTKQWLHLLAFIQSMEWWREWSPWASSELIANIMQEQYYLWTNNFRKTNPAYKYNKYTWEYPKIPDDVDLTFKAQLVSDYSDLLYTIDKDRFADALMYYIRESNPEYASLFTEKKIWEEWKSVAFAKKTTEEYVDDEWNIVPIWTSTANYQANSIFKLDIFTKMQILNGDWDWYAMKNAFSTLYNPNSYQVKDPLYISVALKSMNDNIRYIKESNMSEQDKTSMISWIILWALPMINELQKDETLQSQVWDIYNDTMYRLMWNVTDGIELATEIWYRKLQDGKFKKSPEKTWTILDNYSATWNYYWNYFSSSYNSKYGSYNPILSKLKSFLNDNPKITTSKFDKPKSREYWNYIDSEKKLLELSKGIYFVWELDVWKWKFKREWIKLPSRAKWKSKWKWKWKWNTRTRKPRKFFEFKSGW